MIYVVGLGVGKDGVSLAGYNRIRTGEGALAVKTRKSDTYAYFDGSELSCDDLYDTAEDFDQLNDLICERVLKLEQEHGSVTFCVPGSGATDASVRALVARGAEVELLPAADSAMHALCAAPATSYHAIAAYDVDDLLEPDTSTTLVVYEMDNAFLAGEVKLALSRYYGEDTEVFVSGKRTTLDAIDRMESYDHTTTLCIPGVDLLKKTRYTFADLLRIMRVLVSEDGCPWDRAQTHESICTNLVEEAYEAIDAIRSEDVDNMIEEMGDVLLQAVFHCFIAQKEDEFEVSDVLCGLCEKLLFRHPHVFGAVRADNADSALSSWEAAKREEKKQETLADSIDSIPAAFPQTLRAVKLAKRAAKVGIGDTVDEELLKQVVTTRLEQLGKADDESTLGECLYALSNLCRLKKLDPEIAAKRINDRYAARFRAIEQELCARGINIYDATRAQLDEAVVAVVMREDR